MMFKKALLFLVIILSFPSFSKAQIFSKHLNGYGAKGGITLGNQFWRYPGIDEFEVKKFVLGFNGLLFMSFLNNNTTTIETELQFNQKGATGTDLLTGADFTSKINAASLNVFLKLRKENFNNSFYILMGPKIEYLINNTYPGINRNFNIEPVIAAGPGYEYFIGSKWAVSLEMLLNYSLTRFYVTPDYKISNRALEFRIGIKKLLDPLKSFDKCPPVYL
jgi:hypothetical protein